MKLDEFLRQIGLLSKRGRGFKPHKYLALLAVIDLLRSGVIKSRCISFDKGFQAAFSRAFKKFGRDTDRNRPCAPFFHLSGYGFWELIPKRGQATALAAAKTVGSIGELTKLVDHAEIEPEVFAFFQDAETCLIIEEEIIKYLRRGLEENSDPDAIQEEQSRYSLFAHEKSALEAIGKRVKAYQLGELLANLELYDPQSNRYFEVDLVIIATWGVFVVELKHWSGRIEIRPNSWLQNGSFYKADPHKINSFKAKLLRGLYERHFPSFPSVYFESVVVLTNPDVQAVGQSISNTSKNNPTFDSIDGFLQYLRHQKDQKPGLLSRKQCLNFAAYIRNLHTPGAPRDLVFPGYEIVDRLYQYADRAEVVAKRTDIRHRRLCRLRVFYSRTDLGELERHQARERAFNTLNTVARIGDHPNLLKVWDIPNADGHVVEGSDWSETGTLRDLLDRHEVLPATQATAITVGLLRGLHAAHQECVVHRSVSPENVLMVNDTPKLMNFDLSYRLEDDRVTVIPDVAQLKRSPYIAPEVYAGGQMPEATADLFSIGVILYEMLTGIRAFECSTDLERTKGTLTAEQRERLQSAETPQNLIDLVCQLVQLDRRQRPVDANQVLQRLEDDGEKKGVQSEPNRRLTPEERSGMYHIEAFLIQGAEAQLYRAVGVQGRPVVLKLFDRDVPLQRVVDEQRFAAAIRHPCIPRVDSASQWEKDGRYFIASQWTEGRSLRDEIRAGNHPSLERFRLVADELLDVMTALHENQEDGHTHPILHNDIKPDNILLADRERPALIDFGAASEPCIEIYEGTEGYVAPDLRLGQERKYCQDGDLYALAVTLCEWLTGKRPEQCSSEETGLDPRLVAWLQRGAGPEAEERFSSAAEMRQALQTVFSPADVSPASSPTHIPAPEVSEADEAITEPSTCATPEPVDLSCLMGTDPNPFVSYLNSMHSRDATTDNALAEYQAVNPFFPFIHVVHPLAARIEGILIGSEKRHVILTGHAGDGKSTIAVEQFKRIMQLALDQPLPRPLNPREDVHVAGAQISLIKDFSEWPPGERGRLIDEMLDDNGPRFLLVSNTGTMLEAFTSHQAASGSRLNVESEFLNAMLEPEPQEIRYDNTTLTVINLARLDNLGLAQEIFGRMIAAERWQPCADVECRHHCPVFRNVTVIRENHQTVIPRIFLAYRRIHEYGTRLTLRQLCAHMAYIITAGLTFAEITNLGQKARRPLMAEFMFFNRFFGDNGRQVDVPAGQIRAVQAIKEQNFGGQPCATWERKLWLQTRGKPFELQGRQIPEDIEVLRTIGAGRPDESISAAQARQQVRRAVFFLHEPSDAAFDDYLKTFLRSAMLLDFVRWQTQETESLSLQDRTSLRQRILHVLQEHFTGVRLPEGASTDHHLYVTLSRRCQDVRQSAQVVLARFPEEQFRIRLTTREDAAGARRRELVLDRGNQLKYPSLTLALPFLDYVMLRNQGEIGQDLQASFVDRLERFKGQLIRDAAGQGGEEIMLVRLRTNHTFQRQMFSVRDGRLEVSDG